MFKPEDYGFEELSKNGLGKPKLKEGDYIRMSSKQDKRNMSLVMTSDTLEKVKERFGDKVRVAFDKKGRVVVYGGDESDGRSVVRHGSTHRGKRGEVGITAFLDEYKAIMGSFRRLYMIAEEFAGGEAYIFTPNGERDPE